VDSARVLLKLIFARNGSLCVDLPLDDIQFLISYICTMWCFFNFLFSYVLWVRFYNKYITHTHTHTYTTYTDPGFVSPPLFFFLQMFWNGKFAGKYDRYFTSQMPFLSPSKQCQSTEEKSLIRLTDMIGEADNILNFHAEQLNENGKYAELI